MTGDRTAGGHAHLRRLALGCALLAGGTWLLPAQAKDAAELAISVAEPEGFADLAEARTPCLWTCTSAACAGARPGSAPHPAP